MNPSREVATNPVDAYLHWGLDTEFRHFFPGFPQEGKEDRKISLLIEWKDIEAALAATDLCRRHHADVPSVYAGNGETGPLRTWAVAVPLNEIADFVAASTDLALAIELAEPVGGQGTLAPKLVRAAPSTATTLFAVLDDGCAFANSRFRSPQGGTRLLAIWNQDPEAAGFPVDSLMGPTLLTSFNYGAQWFREDLDNMIALAQGSQEQIYEAAGLPTLRRSAMHGTHVMDLLCGGLESDFDIVFVQFPPDALDDPSGRWLSRYALDGLHYILQHAGPQTTKIIVNLSWGPQTGPRDGTSVLEREVERLVNDQAGRLFVTLPAGNSFDASAHAEVTYATGARFNWVLPPDGHAPAFFEVRWPPGIAPEDAKLEITPPGENPTSVTPGPVTNRGNWYARVRTFGNSTKVLVVVHPTEGFGAQVPGKHGRWLVNFPAGTPGIGGEIHVNVARADHNMGARRRAKASRLADEAFDMGRRLLPPSERFGEIAQSSIRRSGTLNGIATGASTCVVGGYRFRDFRSSPYSSSGPTRGARQGPDYSCMTDVSPVVQGIRASGVRSGTTLRLVGTSSAAPQLGRQLLTGMNLPFTPWPDPPDRPYRIGSACLWPDKDHTPRK